MTACWLTLGAALCSLAAALVSLRLSLRARRATRTLREGPTIAAGPPAGMRPTMPWRRG